MQSVIAGYEDLSRATQAVHRLERHYSIQGLFVADTQHPAWRSFHPERDTDGRYLVVMIGLPEGIARARWHVERERVV